VYSTLQNRVLYQAETHIFACRHINSPSEGRLKNFIKQDMRNKVMLWYGYVEGTVKHRWTEHLIGWNQLEN